MKVLLTRLACIAGATLCLAFAPSQSQAQEVSLSRISVATTPIESVLEELIDILVKPAGEVEVTIIFSRSETKPDIDIVQMLVEEGSYDELRMILGWDDTERRMFMSPTGAIEEDVDELLRILDVVQLTGASELIIFKR